MDICTVTTYVDRTMDIINTLIILILYSPRSKHILRNELNLRQFSLVMIIHRAGIIACLCLRPHIHWVKFLAQSEFLSFKFNGILISSGRKLQKQKKVRDNFRLVEIRPKAKCDNMNSAVNIASLLKCYCNSFFRYSNYCTI